MTDYLDDGILGTALRSEVPERPEGYWASIDATLAAASASTASVANRATPTTAVPKSTAVDAATDIGTTHTSPQHISRSHGHDSNTRAGMIDRLRSWPLLAAAAALILVAIVLTVRLLPSNGETVDTGFTANSALTQLEALPGPTQNLDHWNAVYGVWDCTANDGTGDWLPPFTFDKDDVGIHSHGDGLISIHPFLEQSAGENATFSHFEDSMNIDVTTEAITLDDGRSLTAGTICGGEPAIVQMRRWQSAPDLERDPSVTPTVITEAFDEQRFYNDLEVWTIALAPLDADLPLPPSERFDTLANWWTPLPDQLPRGVTLERSSSEIVLPGDGYTAVRSVNSGAAADAAIDEQLTRNNEASPGMILPLEDAPLVSGTGQHWVAASWRAQVVAELFMYEILYEHPDVTTTLVCWAVSLPQIDGRGTGGCSGADEPLVQTTRTNTDTFTPDLSNRGSTVESVVLWDAPADAAWMIVYTTAGDRLVSEVVDGTSYAAWPSADGKKETISVLTLDGDLVWRDGVGSLPTADVYITAQPGMGEGPLADDLFMVRLTEMFDDTARPEFVAGSVVHAATLDTGTRVLDVFRYESPGRDPRCYLFASAVPSQPGGAGWWCLEAGREDIRLAWASNERFNDMRVAGAPAEAAWMLVSTSDGKTIAAEVVGDLGYAEWNKNLGEMATVTLVDDQLNELWSHEVPPGLPLPPPLDTGD